VARNVDNDIGRVVSETKPGDPHLTSLWSNFSRVRWTRHFVRKRTRCLALAAERSKSEFFGGTGFPACHLHLIRFRENRQAGKPVPPVLSMFDSLGGESPLPT